MIKFFQQTWVSDAARQHWDPIIKDLSNYWKGVERATVAEGFREASIQILNPAEVKGITAFCVANGLQSAILDFDGKTQRIAIARADLIPEIVEAYNIHDDKKIGRYLGFPDCCVEKFGHVWNELKHQDTMLDMIERWHTNAVYIQESPDTNILLRDLGVRPVFHLPCSFRCERTKKTAERIRLSALSEKMDQIYSILRWPVKYSSLHGIAEITTPVMKFRRETDEDLYERSILYLGTEYPKLGAGGNVFPFRKERPLIQVSVSKADDWSDNGFSSRGAMEKGHELILSVAIPEIARDRAFSIIDLGCGNGTLLSEIRKRCPNIIPTGVDISADKIERAKHNVPGLFGKVADVMRMEFDQNYDLGIISSNRFYEAEDPHAFEVKVQRHCKKLLIYHYETMTCSIR